MKHRWPRSLHSQTEAVFHAIRSFREAKAENPLGLRAFGSWESYRKKAHRFVGFMTGKGRSSLLDTQSVRDDMTDYLEQKLSHYVERKCSRQTLETLLSAMGKFEYAVNHYIELHGIEVPPLETEALRLEFYARSRKLLRKSSRVFANRA